ncbi:MAG TPA: TonB-dependent receptor [Gammaproteobacteria bacterium]
MEHQHQRHFWGVHRRIELPHRRLAAAVAAALSAGLAVTANAQQPEEIFVTGTRIVRDGMSTPTPVTAVTADDLQMMAPGQIVDSLDFLPPFFMNDSPDTAASKSQSAGASNANLRGLGANRTLVLLDGRRIVPSNRLGAVDINLFPEALVERVEVVTGGASAAYGTDAVAGVVNFILREDFEGFDVHTQGGITDREDGEHTEVSVAYGTEVGERGHFIASLERFQSQKIETLEGRDWFKSWGLVTNPGPGPTELVRPHVASYTYTFGGLINAPGTRIHRMEFLPDGTAAPFVDGELIARSPGNGTHTIPNGGSGVDPVTDRGGSLVPKTKRGSLFARYDFDLSENTNFYAQFLLGENEVNSVGTLPLGIAGWAGRVYSGNPFLPADIQQIMTEDNIPYFTLERYHSTADLARDRFIMENDTRSLTLGIDSELQNGFFDGWQLSGYVQAGLNDNRITQIDFIRTDRLPAAMDAVFRPGTNEIVCRAALINPERYGDCVPINLLGQGRASQEAIEYVTEGDQFILAETEQDVVEFSMSGEVGEGWGAGPISLAFGAGWREESIDQTLGPDDIIALSMPTVDAPNCGEPGQPACVSGIRHIPSQFAATPEEVFIFTNVQPIAGTYSVSEVFAETLLPLVAEAPAAEQLDLTLAARYANYSGSGGIWAWKTGLDWSITDSVRLRTTISRDIRAATLSERFDRQGVGSSVRDSGLPGAPTYTTTQVNDGDPNLEPEKADTRAFGIVWQPNFVDGLSMSADYYEIDIKDAIAQIGVQVIVDQCHLPPQNLALCEKITRDPATGRITIVDNGFVNQAEARVVGTDLEVGYTKQLRGGATLNARFLATWLHEHSTTQIGSPKRDIAGETGDGSLPEFKSTTYLRYSKGRFSLFAQERFIGSGSLDYDDIEGVTIDDNSVDSRYYTDMGVTWGGGSDLEWELFFNVQNLFDRDPPVAASWAQFSGTRITNDRLFDIFGRRYVLGVDLRF